MSILIGHASISEKGTINGAKGDQSAKEVCTRTWYSKPWDFMAVHPDPKVREKIASTIEDACKNNHIGYGQNDRNTLNTMAKAVGYDITKVNEDCNADCSSLVNVAVVAAGLGKYGSNGWTTRTMREELKELGFKIISTSTYCGNSAYCVRGAIYNKAGSHVVTGLTDGDKANLTLSAVGAQAAPKPVKKPVVKPAKKPVVEQPKPTPAAKDIAVDGEWGTNTTKKAQTVFGTIVDGEISGQTNSCKKHHESCQTTSWKYASVAKGSMLIKAIQKFLNERGAGLSTDGVFGPITIKALQKFLKVTADGYCGRNTVKAFQKWLNAND